MCFSSRSPYMHLQEPMKEILQSRHHRFPSLRLILYRYRGKIKYSIFKRTPSNSLQLCWFPSEIQWLLSESNFVCTQPLGHETKSGRDFECYWESASDIHARSQGSAPINNTQAVPFHSLTRNCLSPSSV